MGGIHLERTYEVLGVDENEYDALIGIAIGYPDQRSSLPANLAEKEQPNQRKSVREFAFVGRHHR